MTDAVHLALYHNHQRFLEAQRGALTRHAGYDAIAGDVPAFQIALLHDSEALLDAARARPTLFAPPWAPADGDAASPHYQLTHMSLAAPAVTPAPQEELHIEMVTNEAQLRDFTEIQAAGFASDDSELQPLFDWFWSKNQGASREPDQAFYVLRRRGVPASVLLTVDTGDALGIYAVATPPASRRQGLSTHLLRTVCAQAGAGRHVCLQVLRGSEAERLYGKLGFAERYVVDVLKSNLFAG
jgi:GNAT superfamily N-acetyltransferase